MTQAVRRLRQVPARVVAPSGGNPEDALEPVLRVVMRASGAEAGAICLFNPADGVLRLAVEVGLSGEGCRRLRKIRAGSREAWMAPLESLLGRRIRVFEQESGPALPPLLEPAESIGAVACLPVYVAEKPRACAILVAVAPASFTVEALRGLEPSLADLARIVEAIGRRAGDSPVSQSTAAEDDIVPIAPETLRRLQSLAAASPPNAGARADTPADERLDALLTERDALIEDRDALERAHAAEAEHLTARLTEAE